MKENAPTTGFTGVEPLRGPHLWEIPGSFGDTILN